MSDENLETQSINDFNYFNLLKKFYNCYLKKYKLKFFSVQLLHIIIAILTLVPPLILRKIIDEAIPQNNVSQIIKLVIFAFLVYLVSSVFRYFRVYHGHKMAQYVTRDMRNDLYNHYQYLSLNFHDDKKTGELMSRVIDDLNRLQEFIHHGPEAIVGSAVLLSGTVVIILNLNVKLTLVTLLYVPFLIFFAYKIMQKMHQAFRDTRNAKANLSDRLEDNLAGIKVIKAFVNEDFERGRFHDKNQEHTDNRMTAIKYLSILFPGSRLLNSFGVLSVISYGAYLTIIGDMTVGTIVAFFTYLIQFREPLLRIVQMSEGLSRFFASTERFFSHLDIKAEILSDSGKKQKSDLKGEVEFKNVNLSYADQEDVLCDINFKIDANQTAALVGPSGAGKTSMVRLIPRFYEVNKGQVLVDNNAVSKYDLQNLRSHISMVMQEDFLFSDSVAENIAYGRPDADREKIVQAAKDANAHEFITKLKNGYDTLVGQRGIKLSGGQRQRVSIARAFLNNPKILILDEATSSVDLETEQLIQEAIDKVSQGRTTFIIAHRLATIVNADQILFIEDGRIMERGNHQELMNKGEKYKEFYEMQFNNNELK